MNSNTLSWMTINGIENFPETFAENPAHWKASSETGLLECGDYPALDVHGAKRLVRKGLDWLW